MSIRLRLTLLYSVILTLTLIVFGVALYTIQAQYTLDSLKHDLSLSGDELAHSFLRINDRLQPPQQGQNTASQDQNPPPQAQNSRPPMPFESFSGDPAFKGLREREIVRVLDGSGLLIASPFGSSGDALPLSTEGLQTVQSQQVWWEEASTEDGNLLIYSRPVITNGQVAYIVQVARSLTERDRSLTSLSRTLFIASLFTILAAFGIGWVLSGTTLRPIHRITQTAQAIGSESDFSRRVDYSGPNDEIGELATTFNAMLSRLQDAYQRVSQALKMQRDFVADVSHELRTPLTTIRGNLGLLGRASGISTIDRADILADSVAESERLIRLVTDLLTLARAETQHVLRSEPVPVKALVEDVCKQAQNLDTTRRIVFDDLSDDVVLGDSDGLKQVMLILLDNAFKYAQGTITVCTAARDTQVEISVQDEGPGIPAEQIQQIFERFQRGETGQNGPGLGLGLAIARTLVEAQSGTLTVESQPGVGSVFKLSLPAAVL